MAFFLRFSSCFSPPSYIPSFSFLRFFLLVPVFLSPSHLHLLSGYHLSSFSLLFHFPTFFIPSDLSFSSSHPIFMLVFNPISLLFFLFVCSSTSSSSYVSYKYWSISWLLLSIRLLVQDVKIPCLHGKLLNMWPSLLSVTNWILNIGSLRFLGKACEISSLSPCFLSRLPLQMSFVYLSL